MVPSTRKKASPSFAFSKWSCQMKAIWIGSKDNYTANWESIEYGRKALLTLHMTISIIPLVFSAVLGMQFPFPKEQHKFDKAITRSGWGCSGRGSACNSKENFSDIK